MSREAWTCHAANAGEVVQVICGARGECLQRSVPMETMETVFIRKLPFFRHFTTLAKPLLAKKSVCP